MQSLEDKLLSRNARAIEGKRVLLRSSLNVPLDESGNIISDFRIRASLKTIKFILEHTDTLYIISHIGKDSSHSLKPVYKHLKKHIDNLNFVPKEEFFSRKGKGVYLFENLRAFDEEKNASDEFAKELAFFADIFVQDAFSVSHREHASIVKIPKFLPSFFGLLFEKELFNLSEALTPPENSAFVLGGSKLSTKEKLVKRFLDKYKKVLLVGALANEALFAKGFKIGASLKEDGKIDERVLSHERLHLPQRYIVFDEQGNRKVEHLENLELYDNEKIFDAFAPSGFLDDIEFVLWNGPFGFYEKGFVDGSLEFLKLISLRDLDTVAGGGDTVALVESLGYEREIRFLSSAGGAMLHFLENETAPGIEAVLASQV